MGLILAAGGYLSNRKQGSIAQKLLLLPSHRSDMTVGLNIFISENNIQGNYNYCYIYKHNRIRTKAMI